MNGCNSNEIIKSDQESKDIQEVKDIRELSMKPDCICNRSQHSCSFGDKQFRIASMSQNSMVTDRGLDNSQTPGL